MTQNITPHLTYRPPTGRRNAVNIPTIYILNFLKQIPKLEEFMNPLKQNTLKFDLKVW